MAIEANPKQDSDSHSCNRTGYGPPTRQELLEHYPARFTWPQLKAFINSGDLGLLKRDKALQHRYNVWSADIRKRHGSTVNYLLDYRLQWGKPDTLSLLPSELEECEETTTTSSEVSGVVPQYFTADLPFNSGLIYIMQNDWPYSVPLEIEHTVIWSRVPIFHPSLIHSAIEARIQQDGVWGFTGSNTPIEDLPSLESCLLALADWGVTMESVIRSPKGSYEEEEMVRQVGQEVDGFVKRRWQESKWETAWFVNPPRLQSIPGLAHIHVFARKKSSSELASWNA
ncbi:hypothetical protein BKA82DRAFT_518109 [Pisolithus tinctorius]|uniref:Uncharacterized protein n=1 Tax=Pisolithus tinctorius Marx 270 TaxID=870435 RepID=A0A0C3NWP1_PISTI|nr:hypothetical protein BKA82DRAFT_518109 [Pisolithus tinctorius]KIO05270.1 hypothetical protein M404DRAFT_518109 [Pisolithus tinctorius Marx 270]